MPWGSKVRPCAFQVLGISVDEDGTPTSPVDKRVVERSFRLRVRELVQRHPQARDAIVGATPRTDKLERLTDAVKGEISSQFLRLQDAKQRVLDGLGDVVFVELDDGNKIHNDGRSLLQSHCVSPSSLALGQHVYKYSYGIVFQHHGIVCHMPQGEAAAELSPGELAREIRVFHFLPSGVGEVSLEAFLNGAWLRRAQYEESWLSAACKWGPSYQDTPCDAKLILRRVERLQRTAESRPQTYHFLMNNCESISLWCMTGRLWSRQVQRAGVMVVGGSGSGALFEVGVLAFYFTVEYEVAGTALTAMSSVAAANPAGCAFLGVSLAVFLLAGCAAALFKGSRRKLLERSGMRSSLAFIEMVRAPRV
jgi:hypothetical protein